MSNKDKGYAGGLHIRGRIISEDDPKAWRKRAKEMRKAGGRLTLVPPKVTRRFKELMAQLREEQSTFTSEEE